MYRIYWADKYKSDITPVENPKRKLDSGGERKISVPRRADLAGDAIVTDGPRQRTGVTGAATGSTI